MVIDLILVNNIKPVWHQEQQSCWGGGGGGGGGGVCVSCIIA